MSVVKLNIIEPEHNHNYVGTRNVRFRGELESSGHGTLFFKWYSNNWDKDPRVTPLGTSLDFASDLPVGSHVIMLSAKDVAGESVANLQSVQHSGMGGGPPLVPPPPDYKPNLIHVLVAGMQSPAADGATLSKAHSLLAAQAPPQWGNQEYQSTTNRLQFRWLFAPVPADGRNAAEINAGMFFDKPGVPPNDAPDAVARLRYEGPLPAALGTGSYRLTLRVERKDNTAIGHEVSRNVVLTV